MKGKKEVKNKEKDNPTQGTVQSQHTSNKQQHDLGTNGHHKLEGSRIIHLDRLQQFAGNLTKHSSNCDGLITLKSENRAGLASTIRGDCSNCEQTVTVENSKKVKGPRGYYRWE